MTHPDHEKNRQSWNKMVELHVNHLEYRTKEVIAGESSLKWIEQKMLGDVTGKSLLHLMCQFGLDTLSWAHKGAVVTGVDISDKSIEYADRIKVEAGHPEAEFIRSDVFELIGKIDKKFDIIFQSYGTHGWLSDLEPWAKVIAHYLKPGGVFLIVDEHPVSWLFSEDEEMNYFSEEPYRTINPLDYCELDTHIEGEHVEWLHPLSEFFNSLIKAGLVIESFDEFNFGYYLVTKDWVRLDDGYCLPPTGPSRYPMLMAIKARKP